MKYDKLVDQGNFLLDVRMPSEVAMGSIKGSVNIPLDQLRSRLSELSANQPIYVTCQVGLRGYLATRILMANGFDAFNLDGGYRTYSSVYGRKR
jgi:rhodanese-related sulfurtransferase